MLHGSGFSPFSEGRGTFHLHPLDAGVPAGIILVHAIVRIVAVSFTLASGGRLAPQLVFLRVTVFLFVRYGCHGGHTGSRGLRESLFLNCHILFRVIGGSR